MKLTLIAVVSVLVLLSGCDNSELRLRAGIDNKAIKPYNTPPGLADCQFFRLAIADEYEYYASNVIVVRCPKASTTTSYQYGKIPVQDTIVSE